MINVSITINNRKTIASISAVRVYPKSKNPRYSTVCRYKMYIYGEYIGMMEHRFHGCGIDLAREMLDYYENISEEDLETYRVMSLYKMTYIKIGKNENI